MEEKEDIFITKIESKWKEIAFIEVKCDEKADVSLCAAVHRIGYLLSLFNEHKSELFITLFMNALVHIIQ